MRRTLTWVLVAIVLTVAASGCAKWRKIKKNAEEPLPPPETMTYKPTGGAGPAVMKVVPAADRIGASNDLKQLQIIALGDFSTPPPTDLDSWTELRQAGKLYDAVKEGHYVVCWNANRANPDAIFAYWKSTPVQGGPAVLVNGTVIPNMTTDEFSKTPKAGKTN